MKSVIEKLLEVPKTPLIPLVSGTTALYLLVRVLYSTLPDWKYLTAVISLLIVFCVSAVLFWKLKNLENDKDKYLTSSVGKIIEDVFRHYGVAKTGHNAEKATAENMNLILKTIVDLMPKLKELLEKTYTKD